MDVGKILSEIWNREYMGDLPSLIKDNGYAYADNVKKDILITGINPSLREGEQTGIVHGAIKNIWDNDKYDTYWSPIKKMLHDGDVDLRDRTDYLDIFYFRKKEQDFLKKEILDKRAGIKFVVDQLNLTQHIIEDVVAPKLLVVKNKESHAYFGKLYDEKGWVWMGYKFEHIKDLKCGELCKISGLIDSNERVAPEIKSTNLKGTLVLFAKHINQYTSLKERPTAQLLQSLIEDI